MAFEQTHPEGRAEYYSPRDIPEIRPSRERRRFPLEEKFEQVRSLAQANLDKLLKKAATAKPDAPDELTGPRDALRRDYRDLLDLQREVISQPVIPTELTEKLYQAITQIEEGLDQADLTFRRRQFDAKNALMRPTLERKSKPTYTPEEKALADEAQAFADKWKKGAKKKGFFGWVKSFLA
jgi:hypothetical protein